MVRFEKSKSLGRKIRADDWKDLGKSSWTQALDMVRAGNVKEGLELAQYARDEMDYLRYQEARLLNMFINHIADTWGEEQVPKAWRAVGARRAKTPTSLVKNVASYVEDAVRLTAEFQRGHNCGPARPGDLTGPGDLTIIEEPDRFKVIVDPCGSGGRMRRTEPFGVTKKAYPWSWSLEGVPYYCVHCSMWYEIMFIEELGFPLKVHENVNKLNEPCIQIYYKRPELVPEQYFTRVGMKKDPSRFVR